jgi:hypothetical protein
MISLSLPAMASFNDLLESVSDETGVPTEIIKAVCTHEPKLSQRQASALALDTKYWWKRIVV